MPRQIQPKVTFYIDTTNSRKKGLAPIKANVTINGKKITRIMEHTLASDWNDNQQRVRPPRPGKWNGHDLINEKLDNLQKEFDEFVKKSATSKLELTPEIIKSFLNGERNFSGKPFWAAYDEYIDIKIIEPKTRQNYKLYKTKLKEFERDKGYKIDYHTINTAFFELYQGYILTEMGLSWNTLATAIKKLKFFMNWSLKKQYHNETGFKEFSCTEKEPTVIFLTMDELTALYNFKFSTKRLNQVRDRFCFGCFTSLSFSDLDNLKPEHIYNGILKKYRQKSKILHEIVLPDAAIDIINRYQGHFKSLPKISHQKFNEYIKECCKKAGITTPVVYKDFSRGITTEKIESKYKLVGAHTARKTFISLFYHQTKDITLTKRNAAITQDKTLRRYMGTDKQMEKEAMDKAFGNITGK